MAENKDYYEMKKDKGKLRWDLVPWECVEPLVDILTFGAEKYSANEWQNVPNGPERYKAALFRHLIAWCKGEKTDPESGRSHLHHALCNLVFMIYFEKHNKSDN